MKIKMVKPCSEISNKIIVVCDLNNPVNTRKLSVLLKVRGNFNAVISFSKSGMLWLRHGEKSVIISRNGEIIINGADNIDDAMTIATRIVDVIKTK
jgi:ArsR family metal-binding transcriptional regulator